MLAWNDLFENNTQSVDLNKGLIEKYKKLFIYLKQEWKIPSDLNVNILDVKPFQWAIYFDKKVIIEIDSSKQYASERLWDYLGWPFDERNILKMEKNNNKSNKDRLSYLKSVNETLLSKITKTIDLVQDSYKELKKELHTEHYQNIPDISKNHEFDKDKLPIGSYEFYWIEPESKEFDSCTLCWWNWEVDCSYCKGEWVISCELCFWKGIIEIPEKKIEKQQIVCPSCFWQKQSKIPCSSCSWNWKLIKYICSDERCPACSWRGEIILNRQMNNPYQGFPWGQNYWSWNQWINWYDWYKYKNQNPFQSNNQQEEMRKQKILEEQMFLSNQKNIYEQKMKEMEMQRNQNYLQEIEKRKNLNNNYNWQVSGRDNWFEVKKVPCSSCWWKGQIPIRKETQETCQTCHWQWFFLQNCILCNASWFINQDKEIINIKTLKCEKCWGSWKIECFHCWWLRLTPCPQCKGEQKLYYYTLNQFSITVKADYSIIISPWFELINKFIEINKFSDGVKVKKDFYSKLQEFQEEKLKEWKGRLNKDKLKLFEWFYITYTVWWKKYNIADINWDLLYDYLPSKFDITEKLYKTQSFFKRNFDIFIKWWNKMWDRKEQ